VAEFAFAAYHQLESGQKVSSVAQRDGAGHKAGEQAIAELQARGLVKPDGPSIRFTPRGEAVLETAFRGLQRTLNGG
jgi:hypothetical protein